MKISFREKLCYGFSSIGVNAGVLLCISYLTIYYTDVAGISAAAVGAIFLVCRILDAGADLVMGVVVDKTNTRWGKARPYMVIGGLGCAVLTVFVFNVPQMSPAAMIAYAGATYFLLYLFNTMAGISTSTMTAYISISPKERTALGSSFFLVQLVVTAFTMIATVQIIPLLGGGQQGWRTYTIILAVVAVIFLFISVSNIKERYAPPKTAETVKLKAALKALSQNKYFFLITLAGLLVNLGTGVTTGVGVYFAKYILGDEGLFSILAAVTLLPSVVGVPIAAALVGKFGKYRLVVIGLIIFLLGSIPLFVAPSNMTALIVGLFIRGLGTAPFLASYSALVAESADYGQWKTGAPIQGVSFSGTSFGNKVGAGLAGAIIGGVMGITGYVGTATTQTDAAITGITLLFTVGSTVPSVFIILLLLPFKKLEKLQPQIARELHGDES